MTWATRITIFRIICVPFFIALLLYYDGSDNGTGILNENYRIGAFIVFLVAAISDGIDGFLARHFNQKSELGAVLDPIADKLLMLSALIVLSFLTLPDFPKFPVWFSIIVITRDVLVVIGSLIIHYMGNHVDVKPHWTGKIATFFLFAAILTFLLKMPWFEVCCYCGGVFTAISCAFYIRDGAAQFSQITQNSR